MKKDVNWLNRCDTHLCKHLHGEAQDLHSRVQSGIRRQHPGVVLCLHTIGRVPRVRTNHSAANHRAEVGATHQGVVETDVSLQAALSVLKLHDGNFGSCDGQDVPQT